MGSARTVTYTISTGISPGTYATITYSTGFTEPYTPYFRWEDRSDPAADIAFTRHYVEPGSYRPYQMRGILFTVEPSSFGFLDPLKPGGYLPMLITHEFELILDTGHNVKISFRVSLYPDRIAQ